MTTRKPSTAPAVTLSSTSAALATTVEHLKSLLVAARDSRSGSRALAEAIDNAEAAGMWLELAAAGRDSAIHD